MTKGRTAKESHGPGRGFCFMISSVKNELFRPKPYPPHEFDTKRSVTPELIGGLQTDILAFLFPAEGPLGGSNSRMVAGKQQICDICGEEGSPQTKRQKNERRTRRAGCWLVTASHIIRSSHHGATMGAERVPEKKSGPASRLTPNAMLHSHAGASGAGAGASHPTYPTPGYWPPPLGC
jgi:hypothetical protein